MSSAEAPKVHDLELRPPACKVTKTYCQFVANKKATSTGIKTYQQRCNGVQIKLLQLFVQPFAKQGSVKCFARAFGECSRPWLLNYIAHRSEYAHTSQHDIPMKAKLPNINKPLSNLELCRFKTWN